MGGGDRGDRGDMGGWGVIRRSGRILRDFFLCSRNYFYFLLLTCNFLPLPPHTHTPRPPTHTLSVVHRIYSVSHYSLSPHICHFGDYMLTWLLRSPCGIPSIQTHTHTHRESEIPILFPRQDRSFLVCVVSRTLYGLWIYESHYGRR